MIHESPPWLKGFICCLSPLPDEQNPSKTGKKEIHRGVLGNVALISINPGCLYTSEWIVLWLRRGITPEKTATQMPKASSIRKTVGVTVFLSANTETIQPFSHGLSLIQGT
jgi:hypothetical protein